MTKSTSFIKQTSFEVEYAPSHITKWRSSRTGLQITYINQPSPIVNGYFAVATEIDNNSGCPHTLEHLIFMGSKKYPYKGLLDNLGNRLYSSTNAWTSVDQTVYTLTTAGWQGFKTLLPIYLDHLFNPTLTEEACLTEVYHIDGKGKEKGVVFSEMQGIESQSWFVSFQKMQETLYDSKSGYSSETGGLMKELRHLTNDQIKQFHKTMYRPDNLCVVITGSVDEQELLEIMTEFESELPELPNTPNKRPFVDSNHDEPLKEVLVKQVEFPEMDESMGELLISWIGPRANDTLTNSAIDMIGTYFTDSPIALFNKHLVEIDHPLATDIDYTTDDYYRTAINFTMNGVPTEKLVEVNTKIKELILSQTKSENIDMKYLKQVIQQQKLKFISDTEKSPSLFSNIAISEFIYGNPDGSDLSKWTKDLQEYEIMLTWTAEQWADLVQTYFVENKSATILGKPSSKLNELIKKQNKQLNKEIKLKYGKEGLKSLQEKLDAAQTVNDTPIPEELLTKFAKPDPSKIEFINTKSYNAGYTKSIVDPRTNQYIDNDDFSQQIANEANDLPLFIHFEDFKSQFTTIKLIMSSTRIDPHLLSYMSIIEEIFSLSIQLPNEYIPYEKVISDINNDLIEFQLDNGYENQFLELIGINIKFESKKYHQAIDWLLKITQYSIFEESRIKVIIEKIINSLPDKKRNGELMMYSCQYRHMFQHTSLRKSQDAIFTEFFYKDLLTQIEQGGFSKIQQDLNTLRQQLFKLDNIKVFILGNVSNLKNPVSSWKQFTQECISQEQQIGKHTFTPEPFHELPRSFQFRSDLGDSCNKEAYFVNIPAAESTHLMTLTKIPTDYLSQDIFKIALASEFLTAVEGPFWRGIRGTGLAYGVNIRRDVETGYLSFTVYRGSDPKQAWLVAKDIVEKYASGELTIDELTIENCIAAIVNEVANSQENNYDAANCKIIDNVFKRRGPKYDELYLKQLNKLNADDIVYALNKYFIGLFNSDSSVVFTSLPKDKAAELAEHFHEVGFHVNFEEIVNEGEEHEEYSEEEHSDEHSEAHSDEEHSDFECTDSEED